MCKTLALVAIAAALVLTMGATTAVAQDNLYALSYYSNAHTTGAPDGVLRLVNDGNVSDSSPAGDLCASIYIFDSAEELNECCSCRITPNGIVSLSVNTNLTNNTLTGKKQARGVAKVVSSKLSGGTCDPTVVAPQIGIRGWLTHPQKGTSTWSITEEELMDSTFGSAEQADLAEDCEVLVELGSGAGICSCADSKQ
jgi:hypothetical protein